jgi:hypothetical protein
MSARQPFIPSSRPNSRLAQRDDGIAGVNGPPDFVADFSNPLHSDPTESHRRNDIQKPLNIGGLLKMKNNVQMLQPAHASQTLASQNSSHTDMATDGLARVANENSDGVHKIQAPQIANPIPSRLRSGTPVAFPANDDGVFRVPELPSAFSRPGLAFLTGRGEYEAHIFTQEPNLDASEPHAHHPLSDTASQLSRRHSVNDHAGQLGKNMGHVNSDRRSSKDGGPVRVPIEHRAPVFGRRRTLDNDKVIGGPVDAVMVSGRKRSRPEKTEDEDERVHINKRYRYDDESDRANGDDRWKVCD